MKNKKVKKGKPDRPALKAVSAAGITIVLAGILGSTTVSALSMESQHQVNNLRDKISEIMEQNRALKVKLAQAESPVIVRDLAKEWGMVEASPTYLPRTNLSGETP